MVRKIGIVPRLKLGSTGTMNEKCEKPPATADNLTHNERNLPEAANCGVDPELWNADAVKDYLMRHRPVAVPRRFLFGRWYNHQRIESLAARFIFRPSLPWPGELNNWKVHVLTKCFGLQLVQLSNGRYRATTRRLNVPDDALAKVELLEELWQLEFETLNDVYKVNSVLKCLDRGSWKSDYSGGCHEVFQEWQRKQALVQQRLQAILMQEYLLIVHLSWPDNMACKASDELTVARYRHLYDDFWFSMMKMLWEYFKVPQWVLDQRMQGALAVLKKSTNSERARRA